MPNKSETPGSNGGHSGLTFALAFVFCALFLLLSVSTVYFALTAPEDEPSASVSAPPPTASPSGTSEPSAPPTDDGSAVPSGEPDLNNPSRMRAQEVLAGMTLDEKLWQLFFVTPEQLTGYANVTEAGSATQSALRDRPVGGVIYFAKNIVSPTQVQTMLTKIQGYADLPLFLAVDEEGGSVQRIGGKTAMHVPSVPAMGSIGRSGDPAQAREVGETIGETLYSLGFNLDLAPVADVLTGGSNTPIGDRSFGADPALVSEMTAALVEGLHASGIASTLKHFPGLGGAAADTHTDSAETARTLDQMRASEFLPFAAGIKAGSEFVMLSHLSATAIDPSGAPASLSPAVLTLLRGELGFRGVAITDSLSMGAITNHYEAGEAAVLAVEAGADMLLMPGDLTLAFDAVKAAVTDGRLTEARIDESVTRILTAKVAQGLLGDI
ncbi:MAG: glycoside hydrolase family 3 protein [Oscillospiraceae bacterium]|nr:glycoside hydrolase family 3 protein [Oscillospiraceae bacterium]